MVNKYEFEIAPINTQNQPISYTILGVTKGSDENHLKPKNTAFTKI